MKTIYILPLILYCLNYTYPIYASESDASIGVVYIFFGPDRTIPIYKDYNSRHIDFQLTMGYAHSDSLKISPLEIIYPTYWVCFRCLADSGDEYKIILDETSDKSVWIKKKKNINLKTWISYLKDCDYIQSSEALWATPGAHSTKIINNDSCHTYTILSIKNDWIEVETNSFCSDIYSEHSIKIQGWLKWRAKEKIIIQKMYSE